MTGLEIVVKRESDWGERLFGTGYTAVLYEDGSYRALAIGATKRSAIRKVIRQWRALQREVVARIPYDG